MAALAKGPGPVCLAVPLDLKEELRFVDLPAMYSQADISRLSVFRSNPIIPKNISSSR